VSNPYGEHVPDPLSPSGYRWQRYDEQPATTMLPTIGPRIEVTEDGMRLRPSTNPVGVGMSFSEGGEGPEHPGGDWANADAYMSYDDVDSRTIIDTGAP